MTNASGVFLNTTGTIAFDAQNFNLASLIAPNPNEYLVSIQVRELSGVANVSRTALSAITVDTVPEPSTVFLFLTGFGAIGLARFRRK